MTIKCTNKETGKVHYLSAGMHTWSIENPALALKFGEPEGSTYNVKLIEGPEENDTRSNKTAPYNDKL